MDAAKRSRFSASSASLRHCSAAAFITWRAGSELVVKASRSHSAARWLHSSA